MRKKRALTFGIWLCSLTLLLIAGKILAVHLLGYPVTLLADGEIQEFRTLKQTVGSVLADKDVVLGHGDIVEPMPEASVYPGISIRICRLNEKYVSVREKISPPVHKILSPFLNCREIIDLKVGTQGLREKFYRILYENEKEHSRKLVGSRMLLQPTVSKILVGTSDQERMYMMPRRMKANKILTMRATGYYPGPEDCGPGATGYTYLDYKAGYGVVAVDPKVIPLRTHLFIDGYGYAIAADIGSAIKGKRIDLCYDTYEKGQAVGVKYLKVYILE